MKPELAAPLPQCAPTSTHRLAPMGGAAILTCCRCGARRSKNSSSGLCVTCSREKRRPKQRYCSQCAAPIHRRARTGLCHPCALSNPEIQAKRRAGVKRAFERPEHRAKMAKLIVRNRQKAMLRPEFREWLHEHGKYLAEEVLARPDVRAKTYSPDAIAMRGKCITEAYLGWCPQELRGEYKRLVRSKRMHSAEARPIIEAKAAEMMRERRALEHPCWDSVIDYMRRLTAVIRLDNGNYRVGLVDLTPGQLLERAESKGYELPRWAA